MKEFCSKWAWLRERERSVSTTGGRGKGAESRGGMFVILNPGHSQVPPTALVPAFNPKELA